MPPISHGCVSNRYKHDSLIYFKIALHFAKGFLVVNLFAAVMVPFYFTSFLILEIGFIASLFIHP